MLDNLNTYAAIAEIFGGIAIVGGAMFGLVQLREYRRRRQQQAAADLCRYFCEPDLARAVTLMRRLPDGLGIEEMKARGEEYEEACQIVGMSFETMGLMVYMDIASFRVVQQLTGGLLIMSWRKMERWIREIRIEQDNPRFGEWIQWLAERLAEREPEVTPAFEAYRSWSKFGQ